MGKLMRVGDGGRVSMSIIDTKQKMGGGSRGGRTERNKTERNVLKAARSKIRSDGTNCTWTPSHFQCLVRKSKD